jgi:uncharacterized protein (DUF1330 family)
MSREPSASKISSSILGEVQKLSVSYGAKLLAKGKVVSAITDIESKHDISIIVGFPDIQQIESLFKSEQYKALIALREEGATISMT